MHYDRGILLKLRQIAKVLELAPSKPSKELPKSKDDQDVEDEEELDGDQTNGDE